MCRALILNEDKQFSASLKAIVDHFEDNKTTNSDLASTLDEAFGLAKLATQTGQPYTVFLVDQSLGDGKDGIEAMGELKKISPDSSAIIFTETEDPEVGIRSYRADAFRYMSKPIKAEELTFVLNALMRSRREEVENKWRIIFSEMMETALHQSTFVTTAKVIVEHSLKLGFKRAHLFWAPQSDELTPRDIFVGIECTGKGASSCFSDIKFNMRKMKALRRYVQSHDAVLIREEDIRGRLEKEIKSIGFKFPSGGWWILALWSGTELLGALTLDFGDTHHHLNTHERTLLNFFARQVAITLERASLYGKEKRTSEENTSISQIGRQVSTGAATQNLAKLLEQIREQISSQFDVSNFSIFLYDEQTNTLKFELLYENGVSKKEAIRVAGHGMEEYMLSQKEEINARNVKEFTKRMGITLNGNIPISWLGAPLQVGEKIIGGVSIQQYDRERSFTEHDKRFLRAVADQVAGAIQISDLKKVEDEDKERMQLMQRASVEMLRIARKNKNDFWLTVLTVATANFGLGFNRALLFLRKDSQDILYGQTGIGTNDSTEAVQEWERDKKRKHGFEEFLKAIDHGNVRLTPFHKMVTGMEIPLRDLGEKSWSLIQSGEIVKIKSGEISGQLPPALINQFNLSECALLPIMMAKANFGFVLVDNKHNQKSLNEKALNSLQSLLSSAGLILEILRQHENSEDLLDANLETLGMASHQSLQKTLDRICKTAYLISQADWAIIHPFVVRKTPKQIEIKDLGHYGELRNLSIADLTNSNPRVGGVSKHVLQMGNLIIENVDRRDPETRKLKLSEHHFIKTEEVKALIGMAIMDPYSKKDALGILYLDYRKPREFSASDLHHAKSLASLAAVAISNAHEMEEVKQRRQFKLATEIAEAVGASLNLETTMDAILEKLNAAFEETRLCVLLYDKRLHALKFAPAALKYYEINNPKYAKRDTFPLNGRTIACRVARQAIADRKLAFENVVNVLKDNDYLKFDYGVKSEFCISLQSAKNELLGILVLEKEQINGFSNQDIELIKTVAQHISIAIERAQQSEELEYKSIVATRTSWAANIAHEINNEIGKILNEAYFIRRMAGENLEIQEHAKSIEESASQLSVSNPWSNKSPELVEINAILKANLQQFTLLRSINVDFQPRTPQTKVLIKTAQFQHILKQLVNNAAQAMQGLDKKKIFVSTQLTNNNTSVEILFQDFGPGISEDKHASAFRRSFTTKESGGYGLLFIRQMVEDIQGDIVLLPYQKGNGATFLIRIPVADLTSPKQSE